MENNVGKRILDNLSNRSGFDNLISNLDESLFTEICNEIVQCIPDTNEPVKDATFNIIPTEVFDRAHEDILGYNDREFVEVNVFVTAIDTKGQHTAGWVSHFNDGSSYGNTATTDYNKFHGKIHHMFSDLVKEINDFKGYE